MREAFRGVDHIGIYVPDMEAATTFLQKAFGAVFLYESLSTKQPPMNLEEDGFVNRLGIAPHSVMRSQRFFKMGNGPDLEVFEIHAPDQDSTTGKSSFGLNHFALYTDDMEAAIARFQAAGGRIFAPPIPIPFPAEAGDGNIFCYGVTPWGMNVELITYPSEMGYEKDTPLRRWNRGG